MQTDNSNDTVPQLSIKLPHQVYLKDIYLTKDRLELMIEEEGTDIIAEMYRLGLEDILKSRCDLTIL